MNSIQKLNSFLEDIYLRQTERRITNPAKQISNFTIQPIHKFNPLGFPGNKIELEGLKRKLQEYPIISFAKEHSLKSEWFSSNQQLADDVAKQQITFKEIKTLFNCSRTNSKFQKDFQNYLQKEPQ